MPTMQMELAMERRDFVEALSAVTARRAGIEGAINRLPKTGQGAEGRAKLDAELVRLRRCEQRLKEAVEVMT